MHKVAISDLDGTLLGPDHKISATSITTVQQWLQHDRAFIIATGRHYREACTIQDDIGVPLYVISSNGARVHDKNGKVIIKQNLPQHIAEQVCQMTLPEAVQINLFSDDHWYCNFKHPDLANMALNDQFHSEIIDIDRVDKGDVIKIFFWGEHTLLLTISEQLKQHFGDSINLTFSLPKCLEVMEAKTNKGSALEALLKQLQYSMTQTVAFGDAMNDLEMLQVVANPMLMGNAQPSLCNALPDAEKILSASEDGVAMKLKQLLNGETPD